MKDSPRKKALKKELQLKKTENKSLKRKLDKLETDAEYDRSFQTCNYERTMQDLREVVEQFEQATISHTSTKEKLEQELKNLQDQFETKTRELDEIQAKIANSPNLRNIKRQVKRAKLTAEKRKTELKVKDDTIELLKTENEVKDLEYK